MNNRNAKDPFTRELEQVRKSNKQAVRPAQHSGTEETEIESLALPEADPWPILGADAYHGVFGEYARLVEPETEADVCAVLLQSLVLFGNCVGREPFFMVGATRHYANLFVAVVGKTSAKKGTALDLSRHLFAEAEPEWYSLALRSGLSSGEGLIQCVADAGADEPSRDKRAMIIETEFGRTLTAKGRDGNTLSAVLRDAWDGRDLACLTREQLRATAPHVSVIAHITPAELAERFSRVDMANGFANRFLWPVIRRARKIPSGGRVPDIARLREKVADAVATARRIGEVRRDDAAEKLWAEVYDELEAEGRDDIHAEVTARAAAQCLRLSMIYALADGYGQVSPIHLRAALAAWNFCDHSARRLFAGKSKPTLANRIHAFLVQAGNNGMTRTEIHVAFHRNEKAEALLAALSNLKDDGRARNEPVLRGSRSIEVWYAVTNERIERTIKPQTEIQKASSLNSSIRRESGSNPEPPEEPAIQG